MQNILIDRTKQVFGRWTVLYRAPNKGRHTHWFCQCTCGAIKSINVASLTRGLTKSCGCLRSEFSRQRIKHGQARRTREYNIWAGMKQRCFDKGSPLYKWYGKRGVTVCPDWKDNFQAFFDYMGKCPDGMSLDRYPNQDGNYEPGNVRWATRIEQANNRRSNRLLTYNGQTLNLIEWARQFGVTHGAIIYHLKRGRSVEQTFNFYKKQEFRQTSTPNR